MLKTRTFLQNILQTADVTNDYWLIEKVILVVGLDEKLIKSYTQ